ncbi:MAG: hypothetical protein P4L43_02280 [Syntrophobacteraceae bacterium]|nr:hypothetical protein [Syntrophobacteraceae bacterium]
MKMYALSKTVFALACFFSSTFLLPGFAFGAQKPLPQQRPAAHPKILVQEPDYNFGTAVQGTTVEHAFAVKNTGNAVLHIRHVKVG